MQHRRQTLKALTVAGLLGPAGLSGWISHAHAKGQVPVAPGLYKVRGDVTINAKPAVLGQLLHPGDTVVTGPESEAIYVIGEDAFLQRGQTSLQFGVDATRQFLRVVTGKVLSVFGKSGLRTIEVSTATIGIRGTGCYIEDEGAGPSARTYFCLCYGSVELTPLAAPQEQTRYSTSHHDKPMYIYNNMKMTTMMAPASVVNHTDEELSLLESLVGRWPPFNAQGGYNPKY